MSHPKYKHIGDPAIRLIEECSELIKAVCKGERFGWWNYHPERSANNFDDLMAEMEDVKETYQDLLTKILANNPLKSDRG